MPKTSSRTFHAFLAAALVVGAGMILAAPTSLAATSNVLTISSATAHPTVPFLNFDGSPPKVFDIDGDGQMEIIAQNDNQYVYIFDSRTGALLSELKTTFPSYWEARTFNGPEVAFTTEGGAARLIVGNSAAYITSYRYDASTSSSGSHMGFVKEWERHLDDCFQGPGMDAKPVLADLDKDGHLEILAATEESGVYVLRDDGSIFWKQCIGGGNAEMTVGDLNQDGFLDVVFGSDGGIVNAFDGLTGHYLWAYNALANFPIGSGSMPVSATVAQLDGIGGPDVLVGARDSHDPDNWANDHALLLAISSTGALLWGRQDPIGNPLTYTRPIVVDANHDGTPEIYWGDWNTIGHKPPAEEADAWKVTGPGHFYRYDTAGNMVWRQTLDTDWSNKDLALGDVDGDGVQEVLASGQGPGGDGVWYLDSNTGAKETFVGLAPWKLSRAPILADLWNTQTMQWIVEVQASDSSVSGGGILVFDTHMPFNAAWPHVSYNNVGPVPPPLVAGAPFSGNFTVKSPDTWWEEVTFVPEVPQPIDSVQIRIANASWQPMSKASWGSWTASYHVLAGTFVEFLATNAVGGTSQSAGTVWMDGVPIPAVVTPPEANATDVPANATDLPANETTAADSSAAAGTTTPSAADGKGGVFTPGPGAFVVAFALAATLLMVRRTKHN